MQYTLNYPLTHAAAVKDFHSYSNVISFLVLWISTLYPFITITYFTVSHVCLSAGAELHLAVVSRLVVHEAHCA